MSNKYIVHGATYDGDGTTSAEATSNGGVGAWSNLINIMTAAPTYGSLAAGDVVNICSYRGGNINIAMTASKTMITVATQTAPIWWIVDDGTIWATGGILTLTWSANYSFNMNDYHNLIGKNQNWVFHSTYTARHSWIYTESQFLVGLKISRVVSLTYGYVRQRACAGMTFWYNCNFEMYGQESTRANLYNYDYNTVKYLGCKFDLSGITSSTLVMHDTSCYHGASVYFIGCSITGGKDTHYVWCNAVMSYSEQVYMQHTNYSPLLGYDNNYASSLTIGYDGVCIITDIPGLKFGYLRSMKSGHSQWVNGENYPTLAGQLPDLTYWGIKANLVNSDSYKPQELISFSKQQNVTASVRKITGEVLIDDLFDTPKNNKWWMEVCWVDTSGNSHIQTTQVFYDEATLTVSNAGWSAQVYGKKNFTKYKFEVITTAAVKQYTDVTMKLWTEYHATGTDTFVFVDPDFEMETI